MARTRSSLALATSRRSSPPAYGRMAPRHGRAFGRGRTYVAAALVQPQEALSADLKQFMTTFLGALVFMAVLIG